MSQENFSRFGTHFQTKVLQSLFVDTSFFDRVFDILKLEYFDSKIHNWIYDKIQKYFEEYKTIPSIENIEVLALSEKDELIKQQAFEVLRTIKKAQINDTKFIKDETIKFCRNQQVKKALYQSIDLYEKGQHDDIPALLTNALRAGEETNIGHDYFDEHALEYRLNMMKRTPLPTGLKHLDIILNGGLSKGELGVVVAGTGLGKSWVLCSLGKAAIDHGMRVAHYTLELYEHETGLRYDTIFTGIAKEQLEYNKEIVLTKLTKYQKNLKIKHYPTKKASVATIKLHVEKLRQQGFIPDILVIDYADLLKSSRKYEQKRFELEAIYEELRGLAGELMIPIWTASQSNRSSLDSEVVSLATISESFAKAAVADVIITLSRKYEDKIGNTARIFVAKNRAGRDGVIIPLIMNLSNYKMETQKPIESIDELKNEIKKVANNSELSEHNKKEYEKYKKNKKDVENKDEDKKDENPS